YATRVTPPKKARKFKKPAFPILSTVSVSPEEPTMKLNLREGMKITAIMIMTQVMKAVIKRATVVMTIPNLTMKKCLILSMKLMRMNRVSNLIKRIMKKTLKMMKRKRMMILLKLRQDETNVKDKVKGDEDIGIDYTTNQFDDDVDERLNETNECLIQKEGNDAEMINIHQGNENQEITLNQVIEDIHRKTSKDDEPAKGLKAKESKSGSSKGTKSQSKSSGKSVHAEELEFEVRF
nr:hypothetical protein [Tanacetum cinerariifolium]